MRLPLAFDVRRRCLSLSEPAVSNPPVAREPKLSAHASGLSCLVIIARCHGLHVAAPQLVRENMLSGGEPSIADVVRCARRAGLKAQATRMSWKALAHLGRALPAMVRLAHGGWMVLNAVEATPQIECVSLIDPTAS